ncbi:Uncharacterised protein [Candidatus Bilamarchaeum dharawalense]|uniref:Uncharacterized protein n=1 Tax=Candidatus Bilamarchaeum dharawalense TaxID=2885759 RepID=A0A5E4LQV4_9ARCH|nr:Uncharacterised protein [Candidatus Bilamarchaeum dharawalense]
MTEVVEYYCKSCGKKHGPLGMHGFDMSSGDGELPVVCKKCKEIFIGRFKKNKLQNKCSTCGSMPKMFDATCPDCSSSEMYFRDLNAGIERKCKD